MSNQMIFKRYELKFMLTRNQYDLIQNTLSSYMLPDAHGRSTIQSLYFDTPTNLLIRNSIEKPVYKEKLRLRSYGVATPDTEVFLELKKKYQDVVYKRREGMSEQTACTYLQTRQIPRDTQIFREIDYTFDQYPGLKPAMLLIYDREAYYGKNDHDFRITFDQNILWRNFDLDLKQEIHGNPLLSSDQILMEVKVAHAIPMWLVQLLNQNSIYKTSFSKYGMAYQLTQQTGGMNYYA